MEFTLCTPIPFIFTSLHMPSALATNSLNKTKQHKNKQTNNFTWKCSLKEVICLTCGLGLLPEFQYSILIETPLNHCPVPWRASAIVCRTGHPLVFQQFIDMVNVEINVLNLGLDQEWTDLCISSPTPSLQGQFYFAKVKWGASCPVCNSWQG